MELRIDDTALRVDPEEGDPFISRHTGRTLARIRVALEARGKDEHERLLETINRAREEGASSDAAGVVTRWAVGEHHFSYTDSVDPIIYQHSMDLEEVEELQPDELRIGDLVLRPHKYEEEFRDDALTIGAWTHLDTEAGSQLQALIAQKGYHPVVRTGISDEAREMRFGLVLWSKTSDGARYRLTLVDRVFDEKGPFFSLGEPQNSNVEKSLALAQGHIDQLLEMLEQKGILSPEEMEQLRSSAQQGVFARRWAFCEVEDADAW